MSRGGLLEQNEALWKGELAVSGFLERQNGLLELKKKVFAGKKNSILQIQLTFDFFAKPHWCHSCSLKPSHAMWSHLNAVFLYFWFQYPSFLLVSISITVK